MKALRVEPERAKAIGRLLFQKYDLSKRGVLEPKQCFEVFSDFCYRILNIHKPPTMEEAESMHKILDANHDSRVTQSDFQALALRYLCGQSSTANRYETRTKKNYHVNPLEKKLSETAKRRLDVARRLFKMFDRDGSGYLTEDEIPGILEETYKDMGRMNFKPTHDDVKSYMRMVDSNQDGKVSLEEFEEIILVSLKKAGIKIYD